MRIGNLEFGAPVAMADSNDVPAIFGRADALDRFDEAVTPYGVTGDSANELCASS